MEAGSWGPPTLPVLPREQVLVAGGGYQLQGTLNQVGSSVTRETSRAHTPHHPFDENNHQLGPEASICRIPVRLNKITYVKCMEQNLKHAEYKIC